MTEGTIHDVLRDMKNGVYNYTNEGKCSRCGNCCSALLPVTNEELKILKRYTKRKHIQVTPKHEGVAFDLICPFYNETEKKCNVYEVRPQICRDFKCDKPQNMIKATRDGYEYDGRFHCVYLREYFGVK